MIELTAASCGYTIPAPPANGSTRATRSARTASPCTRSDPPGRHSETA